jgi:hypothetical protein
MVLGPGLVSKRSLWVLRWELFQLLPALYKPLCPTLRPLSRVRIHPAWVSLEWRRPAWRTEWNSVMESDPVLLEKAGGLVTGLATWPHGEGRRWGPPHGQDSAC